MKEIKITTPFCGKTIEKLRAGDLVLISGRIFTARDLAHERLCDALEKKKKLPFALRGQLIYYTGPTPAVKNRVIGSCGPTTSSRMDRFTVPLLKAGLAACMGKGQRSKEVAGAIKKFKAVYLVTAAGCGAYLSKKVRASSVIAYKELGPEAVRCLEVEDFPAVVAVDSKGKSIYEFKR